MSRKIIENGWNIGCLLPCYQNVDFTFTNKKFWEYGIENMDDLMYPCHRNVKWNDYQLVFIKGNRNNFQIKLNIYNKIRIIKSKKLIPNILNSLSSESNQHVFYILQHVLKRME